MSAGIVVEKVVVELKTGQQQLLFAAAFSDPHDNRNAVLTTAESALAHGWHNGTVVSPTSSRFQPTTLPAHCTSQLCGLADFTAVGQTGPANPTCGRSQTTAQDMRPRKGTPSQAGVVGTDC
jgi:hypothetical protein